ncbi:RcnB family protein [Paucibacter sp. B51]|uniref:RcnB family protein n=1 Tax=Paucibacter sp. B51 TaxID=2993315 RepID=UPI0022EC0836|nr:RcnB family protein [Paucibacter sp. B51]
MTLNLTPLRPLPRPPPFRRIARAACLGLLALSAALVPAQAQPGGERGRGEAQGRDRQERQQREERRQRDERQERREGRHARDEPGDRGQFHGRGEARGAGPDHAYYRGSRLPREYRGPRYVVEDWRGHRLSAPPRGYHWVQSGGDYLLVAIATGVILQLLLQQQ